MAVLLVTYDLDKPGQDYKDILEAIKSYPSWACLSESSYAVRTEHSPQQVYNHLAPYLDQNDHLYVIHMKQPYAGYGFKKVNDWLEANLPY